MFNPRISPENFNPNNKFSKFSSASNGNKTTKNNWPIKNCFVQMPRDKFFDAKTHSMIFRMREVRSTTIHILWT